jgi:tRNA(Ile2) C34 agmatinyltransferase TiaS
MAESAIGQSADLGLVEYYKQLSSKLDTERANRTSQHSSTASQVCPECQSTIITKIPGEYKCSSCGCQFGRKPLVQWGPSRRDVLN